MAFSCKKRGVCHPCNTKHMIFITMHFLEEVLPKLPLRQWVLSVPKWLRYHLTKYAPLASQVLRIFIDEIEKQLKKSCDGISEDAKLGAVSFIQRFGSRLNLHIHFPDVILEIDWQGAQQIKEHNKNIVSIFILPPSIDALKERLTRRNQDEHDVIARRLAEAKIEMSHCHEFDYVVVNQYFQHAVRDLTTVIRAARMSYRVQSQVHYRLLQGLLS